jgi:hypothetical protein
MGSTPTAPARAVGVFVSAMWAADDQNADSNRTFRFVLGRKPLIKLWKAHEIGVKTGFPVFGFAKKVE